MIKNETMVLPKNAVMIQEEEMRYLEGGASYIKTVTVNNKNYQIIIKNIRETGAAALYASAAFSSMILGIVGVCTIPVATGRIASAALTCSSVAVLGANWSTLKSNISIKRVSHH